MSTGEPYFQVTVEPGSRPSRVVASGELDAASARQLEDALTGLDLAAGVEVDLSAVSFIDSSGLRVITATSRQVTEAGGTLTIVAASDAVRRIFEMTGLTAMLSPPPPG